MKSMHVRGLLSAFALALLIAGYLQASTPTPIQERDSHLDQSELQWH